MTTQDGFITTADGLRLFYRQAGTGSRVVLFINGVVTADDFAPIVDGRTVVFFDPRNRGRSDAVRDRSQIERGIHHDSVSSRSMSSAIPTRASPSVSME
jgi:pimeloyl-ACP methyl ester carboxylesterase